MDLHIQDIFTIIIVFLIYMTMGESVPADSKLHSTLTFSITKTSTSPTTTVTVVHTVTTSTTVYRTTVTGWRPRPPIFPPSSPTLRIPFRTFDPKRFLALSTSMEPTTTITITVKSTTTSTSIRSGHLRAWTFATPTAPNPTSPPSSSRNLIDPRLESAHPSSSPPISTMTITITSTSRTTTIWSGRVFPPTASTPPPLPSDSSDFRTLSDRRRETPSSSALATTSYLDSDNSDLSDSVDWLQCWENCGGWPKQLAETSSLDDSSDWDLDSVDWLAGWENCGGWPTNPTATLNGHLENSPIVNYGATPSLVSAPKVRHDSPNNLEVKVPAKAGEVPPRTEDSDSTEWIEFGSVSDDEEEDQPVLSEWMLDLWETTMAGTKTVRGMISGTLRSSGSVGISAEDAVDSGAPSTPGPSQSTLARRQSTLTVTMRTTTYIYKTDNEASSTKPTTTKTHVPWWKWGAPYSYWMDPILDPTPLNTDVHAYPMRTEDAGNVLPEMVETEESEEWIVNEMDTIPFLGVPFLDSEEEIVEEPDSVVLSVSSRSVPLRLHWLRPFRKPSPRTRRRIERDRLQQRQLPTFPKLLNKLGSGICGFRGRVILMGRRAKVGRARRRGKA